MTLHAAIEALKRPRRVGSFITKEKQVEIIESGKSAVAQIGEDFVNNPIAEKTPNPPAVKSRQSSHVAQQLSPLAMGSWKGPLIS